MATTPTMACPYDVVRTAATASYASPRRPPEPTANWRANPPSSRYRAPFTPNPALASVSTHRRPACVTIRALARRRPSASGDSGSLHLVVFPLRLVDAFGLQLLDRSIHPDENAPGRQQSRRCD